MNELDNVLSALLMLAALAVAYGFFCRMNSLRFFEHRTDVVAFHLLGFGGCFWTAVDAFQGDATVAHACFVGFGVMWLVISLPTWRHGIPPEHVSSDFGPLQTTQPPVKTE